MESDAFVGLPLGEAEDLAASNGLYLEVLDGTVVDAMVDARRVRVVVTDGIVTQAWSDVPPVNPQAGPGEA